MRPAGFCLALVVALVPLLISGAAVASGPAVRPAATIDDPYQASQQTLLDFGKRSHWLQPWRGYLETVPARRVTQGLGIVFNPPPGKADRVAAQAVAAGLSYARLEISWCRVDDSDSPRLEGMSSTRRLLLALKKHKLRPLILLNANDGCPGPLRKLRIHVTAAARAGDRQIAVDQSSARAIVPGHTGLDIPGGKAAAYLITAVSGTRASLSRPLAASLSAGSHEASTLRYEPFTRPGDARFEETINGWLEYVALVTSYVKGALGNDDFDVEVWNELSFGSDFLDAGTYYNPEPVPATPGATEDALLERTLTYVRNPANGLQDVGVGDGFSNLRPWDSGANVPAGLTAIDKHPYPPRRVFPQNAVYNQVMPLDALGRAEGTRDAAGRWHDAFVPAYTSFFPEYFLSGIQTETAIRDLSPITTDIYGVPHGRTTHPPGGSPPAVWLTEAGMSPASVPKKVLPSFHAKGALRWATSWLNKGATRVYFYAAASPGWGIVEGGRGGGLTLRALGRLTSVLDRGSAPVTKPRSLSVLSVSDPGAHRQFDGDGTSAHPPLYDADVLGFFPFQSSNGRVVVAVYVMTRDLMHVYRPELPTSKPARYDMPPEWFRITIGGTTALGSSVSATDPLTGASTGVKVVSRTGDQLVLDVAVTDSPRLLVLGS
jgi:hypothetical protein